MKGTFVLLMLMLVANAGCNLTVNVVDNPPPSPTSTQPGAVVERPTNKPPTLTPLPTVPTAIPATAAPTCTPRTDWPLYKVVAGDTLGRIAVRAGSSTTELIQANCLTNANLIAVGQSLRVPRQPTPPTTVPPTLTPTLAVQNIGTISVSPTVTGDAGNFQLNGGTTITIKWESGPADAVRVDFFRRAFDGTITLIGSDGNASDGLSATWIAQPNFQGTLTASAIRADGSHVEPYFTPTVYVNDPSSPDNAIVLNTYLRVEGDTYFVRANQPIVLTWKNAPRTDQRVDFKFSPADRTKQPYVLGSDTNLSDGLATLIVTFAAGDLGIISAESYRPDGKGGETRGTFAKAVTISASAPEATAEATAEVTQNP
ncbi:MAG: LysM peptidoglycan-binding domain-containing protein [Anaerolineaceae bacterium]|nr:LysM peptidoglycan-binding domain-containing protein [Anaerolineaceae bacterium]